MRSLALKLAPGQDLRLSLETLATTTHRAMLGVVGNLSRAASALGRLSQQCWRVISRSSPFRVIVPRWCSPAPESF